MLLSWASARGGNNNFVNQAGGPIGNNFQQLSEFNIPHFVQHYITVDYTFREWNFKKAFLILGNQNWT